MRTQAAADRCYGLALATMPLAGVGLVRLLSGHDLGAGLQPAYLLLAGAWGLRLVRALPGRDGAAIGPPDAFGRRLVRIWLPAGVGVVLLSAGGLWLAPAPLMAGEVWSRFARQAVQIVLMLAFLAYPALWTRGPRRWAWTLRLLGLAAAVQIVYAALQGLHVVVGLPGFDLLERAATSNPAILSGSTWLYLGGFTDLPRLRGAMCEPIYLGNLLVGLAPLLLHGGRRTLGLGAAAVLVLTWARSAWVGGAAALLVWWLLRRRAGLGAGDRRILGPALLVGAVVLLVIVVAAGPAALLYPVQRLVQVFDQGDWSNLTRLYSWQAAWRAWWQSPLIGIGWGQFPYHFYALVDLPGLASQFSWPVVNSMPLLVLCELGLVGSAFAAAALIGLWRRTWRQLADGRPASQRARLAAVAAGCCGMGVHLCVVSQYNLPHIWVLTGLWLAALAPDDGRARQATERS